MTSNELSILIKDACQKTNFSQQVLADHIGISKSTLDQAKRNPFAISLSNLRKVVRFTLNKEIIVTLVDK